MLDHPGIKTADLSSMQRCVYAMAPMDQRTLEEGIRAFGAEFFLGTGQTECFPSTNSFRGEFQLTKKGNYWGESACTLDTAVLDENGNRLPPGQVGEIVWRGPGTMSGYLKNAEATAESRKFGWHHSGDLGYFDEDGLLVFVDRKKDMIKTGGENVPSVKVERTLLANPKIAAAAVVGLPNERWVEAVTAFVVPTPGAELKDEEVIAAAKKELGGFEVPKKVVIVKEMPMTSTGKIKKNILREQYKELYKG
jgi:long-chain acyl-CoA synthetase